MKFSIFKYGCKEDIDYREQVRAKGKDLHKKFNEVIQKLIEKRNITLVKLSKEFGVSDKQLRLWRTGKAAIPLKLLKGLCSIRLMKESEVEKLINEIGVYGSKKITPPKRLTEEIAEIVGRHCGDGCCIKHKKVYRVTLTEHKNLIKTHCKQVQRIFGIKPTIINIVNDIECAILNSKIYYRFFIRILKIPSGKKTEIVKEPIIIKKAGLKYRKRFVRGLIDTEGSLYRCNANRSYVLEVHMKNKYLIKTIFNVLKKLNFNPRILEKKKSYSLRLTGKKNIKNYFKVFGTSNMKFIKNRVL